MVFAKYRSIGAFNNAFDRYAGPFENPKTCICLMVQVLTAIQDLFQSVVVEYLITHPRF